MHQLEMFQMSSIETGIKKQESFARAVMLEQVGEAYARYIETVGGNRMYADHILFAEGDSPTFTVVPEFWPEMVTDYMDQAHPTMWNAIVER